MPLKRRDGHTSVVRRGVPQLFSQSSFFCDIEGTVWYFSSRFNGRDQSQGIIRILASRRHSRYISMYILRR